MPILIIERSTARGSTAVFHQGLCLAHITTGGESPPDGSWVVGIQQALRQAACAPASIEAAIVGLGPGSHAGIRAALAFAQGLCLPGQIPLLGVNSAAAMAESWRRSTGRRAITVIGDARRGHWWLGRYAADTPLSHDARDFTRMIPQALPEVIGEHDYCISPDWNRIGRDLRCRLPGVSLVTEPCLPSARDIGFWLANHPNGARRNPLPIYLFPAVSKPSTPSER